MKTMASSGRKNETMIRRHRFPNPGSALLLLLLVVSFSHAPHVVDSFTMGRGPSLTNHRKFGRASQLLHRPLSSKYSSDVDEESIDYTSSSNTTTTTKSNSTTEKETTTTTTTGYRRIEEWHEENHDSKHVIRHLKRERTRWNKTFDNLAGKD